MFIQLHDKNTNHPFLVNESAINTITTEHRGRMTDSATTVTIVTVGNERYEVAESYEKIFWMVSVNIGRYIADDGGDSAK